MVDKGPLLTSAIIFYLSIGAAIFQVLEEPNWKLAVTRYNDQKEKFLRDHPCLTKEDLDKILEVVSEAAGQGVTITGEKTFNNWNWPNAVIFAATVITTIGYGNIAPKTSVGRVFCIFYGLFGVPLCLTWISELGKFFGGRAKHLGQFLTKRGVKLRKAQFTCTAIFLLWGVLIHLVIPPFIFMSQEGWTYIEGLYFSFVTLTTIGFGDLVAGVDPNADYPTLYRYFVEVWIYLGLAWLSLFFNWKVRMVIEAHKALKKRRRLRKLSVEELQHYKISHKGLQLTSTNGDVNIFSFMSKKKEGYNDLIKQIGSKKEEDECHRSSVNPETHPIFIRSKSCNDAMSINANTILNLEESPRQKRRYSFSERVTVVLSKSKNYLLGKDGKPQQNPTKSDGDLDLPLGRLGENQLDKGACEEPNRLGPGGGASTWDSEHQPLVFRNANITFIDENNLGEDNEEDLDTKPKLSTSDDNGESESDSKDDQEVETDTSVFTEESESSQSYEYLVKEYSKENNAEI